MQELFWLLSKAIFLVWAVINSTPRVCIYTHTSICHILAMYYIFLLVMHSPSPISQLFKEKKITIVWGNMYNSHFSIYSSDLKKNTHTYLVDSHWVTNIGIWMKAQINFYCSTFYFIILSQYVQVCTVLYYNFLQMYNTHFLFQLFLCSFRGLESKECPLLPHTLLPSHLLLVCLATL